MMFRPQLVINVVVDSLGLLLGLLVVAAVHQTSTLVHSMMDSDSDSFDDLIAEGLKNRQLISTRTSKDQSTSGKSRFFRTHYSGFIILYVVLILQF